MSSRSLKVILSLIFKSKNVPQLTLFVLILCLYSCTPVNNTEPESHETDLSPFTFELDTVINTQISSVTSIATADLDLDGDKDLLFTTGHEQEFSILFSDGSGGFEIVTEIIRTSVGCCYNQIALTDINSDGYPDAVVTDSETGGYIHVFYNNQNGKFEHHQSKELLNPAAVTAISTGDFNRDGIEDITVNRHFGKTSLFLSQENKLGKEIEINGGDNGLYTYLDIATADFNNDGFLDIAHASPNGIRFSFLDVDPEVALASQKEIDLSYYPIGLEAVDLNNDGISDLASIDSYTATLSLLLNNDSGNTFKIITDSIGTRPVAISTADFDNDGDFDIVIADAKEHVLHMVENQGDNQYESVSKLELKTNSDFSGSTGVPYKIVIEDLNEDENADIIVSSFFTSEVFIFMNENRN